MSNGSSVKEWDQIMKFFHYMASTRKKHRKIGKIQDEMGNLCHKGRVWCLFFLLLL